MFSAMELTQTKSHSPPLYRGGGYLHPKKEKRETVHYFHASGGNRAFKSVDLLVNRMITVAAKSNQLVGKLFLLSNITVRIYTTFLFIGNDIYSAA